jgi:hypothetical protein
MYPDDVVLARVVFGPTSEYRYSDRLLVYVSHFAVKGLTAKEFQELTLSL